MIEVATTSIEATQALAEALGRALRGGEVIELISDVGGGKTAFTKGLARGLQIGEVVQSPTFTISRLYQARDGLELHHFDFYRLQEPGVMAAELAESIAQSNVIVVTEWGDIVHDVLPQQHLRITIASPGAESNRLFSFAVPADYDHLLPALNHFKITEKLA